MDGVIEKLKSDKAIMQRRQQLYDGLEYLEKNEQNSNKQLKS